MIILTGVNID